MDKNNRAARSCFHYYFLVFGYPGEHLLSMFMYFIKTCSRTPKVLTGTAGRPSYNIPKEQLEVLLDVGFNIGEIAELFQVGKTTIERRISKFGVSARPFSDISNEDLDSVVREIKLFYPNLGSKNLAGHLTARNIRVPRAWIRDFLRRVDPLGLAAEIGVLRLSPIDFMAHRRNHKLIRWWFVVPRRVYSYTRILVFFTLPYK